MNYINFTEHFIYKPKDYYRRFDIDLSWAKKNINRILSSLLPFIALYQPAGSLISWSMNSSRVYTHLSTTNTLRQQGKWAKTGLEISKTALTLLSLGASYANYTSGLLLTTSCDIIEGGSRTCHALAQRKYHQAAEELLQTLSSTAYLAFMATGSLEAMLIFSLIQTISSLHTANMEFSKGRYIEGCAKLAMAPIRLNQAHKYLGMIQQRNAFLELERTNDLLMRILRGRQATHLIHHPLSSLKEKMKENEMIVTDPNGQVVDFGSHFHGIGQSLVKGENIGLKTLSIDGKEIIELDFKINHAFREKVERALQLLKSIPPEDRQAILDLSGSHAQSIDITSGTFRTVDKKIWWYNMRVGAASQVRLDGLGTISVGADPNQPTLYDRVVIQMDSKQTLYGLHEMLCLLDLDQAIRLSSQNDIERLKIGHLFRTFFPKEASPFERTEEFFQLPLDQLKEKIIEKSPDMRNIFDIYLKQMYEEEILTGKIRYRIDGLAQAAYEKGARALIAAITGASTDQELYTRVASILQLGMLSTETRDNSSLNKHGLGGSGLDYASGGADSVFTQLITKSNCSAQLPFSSVCGYSSKVRLIISLDALETGTYQYFSDSFGNRVYKKGHPFFWNNYPTRDNILDFIEKKEHAPSVRYLGHEVMFKERIAPSFFKGVVVPDEKTKQELLVHLQQAGAIQNGKILNQSAEDFIRVSKSITEELIA